MSGVGGSAGGQSEASVCPWSEVKRVVRGEDGCKVGANNWWMGVAGRLWWCEVGYVGCLRGVQHGQLKGRLRVGIVVLAKHQTRCTRSPTHTHSLVHSVPYACCALRCKLICGPRITFIYLFVAQALVSL